ncbi:MAG: preprotein translocase subunit SecG [Desulfuromonadales bacterium]|nr:preprotein translocase subunit SecG [Desulfuromonadales bacterium]
MDTLLVILHVTVSIALIIIVLLQAGKGAQIGASFGAGSSQTVFGAGGGKNFMHRVTVSAAIIFMLTSLTLAYFYGQPGSASIMPEKIQTAQPAAPTPDALPAPTTPSAPATDKADK